MLLRHIVAVRVSGWLALLALSASACVSSDIGPNLAEAVSPLKGRLPPCDIDVEASEVSLDVVSGQSVGFMAPDKSKTPYPASLLRQDIADALAQACSKTSSTPPRLARFRLSGDAVGDKMMIELYAVIHVLWVILPLPLGTGEADLTLEYDYGGTVYTSKVRKKVLAGMFYNQMPADDAFVDALAAAIADIGRQMRATVTP